MKIQTVVSNRHVEHLMGTPFPDDPQQPVAVDLDKSNDLHPVLDADILCLGCGQSDETVQVKVRMVTLSHGLQSGMVDRRRRPGV
jgi:hypothetical protein